MNKKHLFWIIPLTLLIGGLLGSFIVASGLTFIMEDYPIIGCIQNADLQLNPATNKLPFTTESQRKAIEWRCAKEYVDFNINSTDEIFVFK